VVSAGGGVRLQLRQDMRNKKHELIHSEWQADDEDEEYDNGVVEEVCLQRMMRGIRRAQM